MSLTTAHTVSSKGTCVQRMGFNRRQHPQKLRLHPHPLPSWNTASGWCLRERKDKQTDTLKRSAMLSMRAHTFSHVHTHTDGRQRVSVEMQTLGCSSHWVPKAMLLCQFCLDEERRWYCISPEIDIVHFSHLKMRINTSWVFLIEDFQLIWCLQLQERFDSRGSFPWEKMLYPAITFFRMKQTT